MKLAAPQDGLLRLIVSLSSDIGNALALYWLQRGIRVAGTFRHDSAKVEDLRRLGALTVECDLLDSASIAHAIAAMRAVGKWESLVLAAGTQAPVGLFSQVSFADWRQSIESNLVSQLEVLHGLLDLRDTAHGAVPSVILFAGGATNSATTHYSAYTVSKIASIKMCELLDAEIPDTKFSILGPGWVRTKIHQETIGAGAHAGANLQRTMDKLGSDEMYSMSKVVECVNWIIDSPREEVGGRNISAVFDPWGSPELTDFLVADPDAYRLRRHGNQRFSQLGGGL